MAYMLDKSQEVLDPQINILLLKQLWMNNTICLKIIPRTTFINAHMGWMANDLDKLEVSI
jgi:hypothetical protein